MGLLRLEKAEKRPTHKCMMEGRVNPARLFLVALSSGLRGNRHKLKYRRRLKHQKDFLIRQWSRLP